MTDSELLRLAGYVIEIAADAQVESSALRMVLVEEGLIPEKDVALAKAEAKKRLDPLIALLKLGSLEAVEKFLKGPGGPVQ